MVSNNENIAHRKRPDQSNGERPSLFSGNGENETKLTNEKRQKKEMIKKTIIEMTMPAFQMNSKFVIAHRCGLYVTLYIEKGRMKHTIDEQRNRKPRSAHSHI